jgi:hypothetical protein
MKVINLFIAILFIYSVCFFSIYAKAEENGWKLYYTNPDGTKHFYDLKSITLTSKVRITTPQRRIKTRKGYTKVLLVKVKEKIIFNNPDSKLTESSILREFDCSKSKVRMLMKSEFFKDGSRKIEWKSGLWKSIDSEPFYKALYEIVCQS